MYVCCVVFVPNALFFLMNFKSENSLITWNFIVCLVVNFRHNKKVTELRTGPRSLGAKYNWF